MKNQIAKLTMFTLVAAALLALPALSRAGSPTNAPAASHAKPPKKAASSLPFRGTVTALDSNTMTLTVGERIFNISSETKITKDGKPAVLADGVAGEPVSGSYRKGADDKLNAATIHFTTKPADKKKSTDKKKSPAAKSN